MNERSSLSSLPPRLRIAWAAWAIVGVVLFGASIKFRQTTTVGTLAVDVSELQERSEQQYESMMRELRKRPVYQLGTIPLPEPDPSRRLGWPWVVADTTGAESLDTVDVSAANTVFSRIPEGRALVNYIITGEVVIEDLRLMTPDPSIPKSGGPPRYRIDLTLRNLLSRPLTVEILRGQVFENTDRSNKLQNLVAAEGVTRLLPPDSPVLVQIPAYCLNEDLGRPRGQVGNITPLKIRFEFRDQEALWRGVDSATP